MRNNVLAAGYFVYNVRSVVSFCAREQQARHLFKRWVACATAQCHVSRGWAGSDAGARRNVNSARKVMATQVPRSTVFHWTLYPLRPLL